MMSMMCETPERMERTSAEEERRLTVSLFKRSCSRRAENGALRNSTGEFQLCDGPTSPAVLRSPAHRHPAVWRR